MNNENKADVITVGVLRIDGRPYCWLPPSYKNTLPIEITINNTEKVATIHYLQFDDEGKQLPDPIDIHMSLK
jgi:hypothetical protein